MEENVRESLLEEGEWVCGWDKRGYECVDRVRGWYEQAGCGWGERTRKGVRVWVGKVVT